MAMRDICTDLSAGLRARFAVLMGTLVIFSMGMFGLASSANAAGSYTFAGLEWGSSAEDAIKHLRSKGFKVSKPKSGPATEFAAMNMWLDIRKVDRGKRVAATGKYQGKKVEVDLVFGFNDALERVHVRAPIWDGTQKGAKRVVATGEALLGHFEQTLGRSRKKAQPFGFVDTAEWNAASDGSNMEMYIRGAEGFMFFPKHTTSLSFNFWNDNFRGGLPTVASSSDGPSPSMRLKQDNIQ